MKVTKEFINNNNKIRFEGDIHERCNEILHKKDNNFKILIKVGNQSYNKNGKVKEYQNVLLLYAEEYLNDKRHEKVKE